MSQLDRSTGAAGRSYLFTSESVTEGHPDKICDQVSDAILDALLAKEAELQAAGYVSPSDVPANVDNVRCACETFVTTGTVLIAGEIRTEAYLDVQNIARDVIRRIGYTRAKFGFDADTCGVLNLIHEQSYATDETSVYMPMPHYLASRMAERLTEVRKNGQVPYLRPDGKTQVTVRYEDDRPVEVTAIVVSTQHDASIEDLSVINADMVDYVIAPVMYPVGIEWHDAEIYVNPTGRFVVGGPMGDTGLTGRKIIVDTYGGMGRHGGGCFSGKDCTKVDRSAAYAARWVAKNVVAAGLAHRCEIELAYAIGVSHPLSVMVDTFGTGTVADEKIEKAVEKVFDLRPGAIIRDLDLRRPIYEKTAAYGHFGRELPEFTWERTDRVEELRSAVAALG